MPAVITHKRGNTFFLTGTVKLNGVAQDISGWQLKATVCKDDVLVEELVCTVLDGPKGIYTVSSALTTSKWPLGELRFDVLYNTGAQVTSTETVAINCTREVSRWT